MRGCNIFAPFDRSAQADRVKVEYLDLRPMEDFYMFKLFLPTSVLLGLLLTSHAQIAGMADSTSWHTDLVNTIKQHPIPFALGTAALAGLGYLGYHYYSKEKHPYCWGMSAFKGRRPTMEDTHVAINNFGDNPHDALFGIFDGHGGREVADYVANKLPGKLLEKIKESPQNTPGALTAAFLELDATIPTEYTGSTAVVGLLKNKTLHLAWAGDSRAMLIRGNQIQAITQDHKPDSPQERARIEAAGGTVIETQPLTSVTPIFRIKSKIPGMALSVSRAFGDTSYKPNQVIAEPEIISTQVQPGDMLILACDGMWDTLSPERVIEIINESKAMPQSKLRKENPVLRNYFGAQMTTEEGQSALNLIARALRNKAYSYDSTDNISVMVVQMH